MSFVAIKLLLVQRAPIWQHREWARGSQTTSYIVPIIAQSNTSLTKGDTETVPYLLSADQIVAF